MRKRKIYRVIALFLAFEMMADVCLPTVALALTSGPSQPEVQSFEPIGTSEMVDLFSGDFNYNIPLLDAGGYPINISYHSGITMDQEASWVGLGWNINPGAITRNMRSLPDDFNGDLVKKEFSVKNNHTYGVNVNVRPEVVAFNILKFSYGVGVSYNNYKGVGFEISFNPSVTAGNPNKTQATIGLGLSAGSESGVGISPSVSFESKVANKDKSVSSVTNTKIGLGFNSREGLKGLTLSTTSRQSATKTATEGQTTTTTTTTSERNGGSSISFTSPGYTPQISMPMVNTSFSFAASFGSSFFGVDPMIDITGYYSGQYLKTKEQILPGYGYLYTHKGNKRNQLLDFNRENDGTFTSSTPNLPVTNFNFDIYSVAGQGIGGMYRPFRSEVGIVYDNEVSNIGGGVSVGGLEFGAGAVSHGGLDVDVNFTESVTGKWNADNTLASVLKFRGNDPANPAYEPFYFKQAGEKTAETDPAYLANIGAYDPVRVGLHPGIASAQKQFIKADYSAIPVTSGIYRKQRQRRNQAIHVLNAREAASFGLEKKILSYNGFNVTATGKYIPAQELSRLSYKQHHISEITALRPDGARYVFGIPAYNNTQEEVSFAVDGSEGNSCQTGLISYQSNDDTKNNNRGLDNFYSKTTMPAYAHSYLLTSIISPDYVDLTGNGPSDDDLGSFTKINYTKAVANYQWRTPYSQANFNEGLKSDPSDNKASYVYGTKDVWYVHSIETRTHLAEFILEDRADSYGTAGRAGGRGAQTLKKLVRIDLYAKPDKMKNASPTPIKSVHFEYDYSLGANPSQPIPNNIRNVGDPADLTDAGGFPNQGGKLTLKKIFFTYGKSNKGRLNSYRFNYAEDRNFPYNIKSYDRWGNYKPNPADASCGVSGSLSTSEYPYAEQDKTKADLYAAAWTLSQVELPSGGKINVDYESDDYAYVQDKAATQMFFVTGTGTSAAADPEASNELITGGNTDKNYLFFKLKKPISSTLSAADAKALIKKQYIRDMSLMYFRFLMRIDNNSRYEYVPGYAEFTDFGVATGASNAEGYTHGYIHLKEVGIGKNEEGNDQVNPISRAAWQYARLYLPRVVYNQSDINASGVKQILQAMAGSIKAIVQLVKGFNRDLRSRDFGKIFVPNKSWIKLHTPDGYKLGGGVRVKRISMSDEWNSMTGNQQSEYGQVYDYNTTNEFGETISSGVASYEPQIGGDENPFKEPIFFDNDKERLLAPSEDFYIEKPLGESFFPGASVGYSKVTVRNLQYDNVNKNATGTVVNEFYTSKDFPTITKQTPLAADRNKTNALLKLLKIKVKDYMTASQGYSVELNDMHGKQKAQWIYAEGKSDPISGVEYFYKQTKENIDVVIAGQKRKTLQVDALDNEVNAIEKSGGTNMISRKIVGVDHDFVVDMRQSRTITISGGMRGNLDAFLAAILPVVIPVALPAIAKEEVRFRSAVTTKVINKYGLIDRVVAHDAGASVSTKNLLYDAHTGEVLLTETTNQFGDPLFSFNYPAHWAYDRMGAAFENIGLQIENASLNNIANARKYFVPGDELYLLKTGAQIGWVSEVHDNAISVINKQGQPVDNSPYTLIKVLRSGKRNQQTTSIGSIASLKNPMIDDDANGIYDRLSFADVIQSGAVEFSEQWRVFCECGFDPNQTYNPYVAGALGNWKALRSHLFLTSRTQSTLNNNTSVRHDGVFADFEPFWQPPATVGLDWTAHPGKWTFTTQVSEFSPFGFELENKDALNRYSAAVYGYNHVIPIAVSNNSKYRETAFDGFEDYDFGDCAEDHFSFRGFGSQRATNESHTGRNSIRVSAGSSVEVEKIIRPCDDK